MTDYHRLYERPLVRAHALAETWDGDHTPITRHEAAELLYAVLATTGWTETEPPDAHLTVVPAEPECGWRLGLCAGCPSCTAPGSQPRTNANAPEATGRPVAPAVAPGGTEGGEAL